MNSNSRPDIFHNALHEVLFIMVISSTQLLTQAALGNILVPLSVIGTELKIPPNEWPWTLAAYSLTVGIFILITGRLGDVFGHKLMVIIGFLVFSIFSILSGLAAFIKVGIYFDVMRACQGIGPAMLLPNAVALLARTYPIGVRKSIAFSVFGAAAPTGFILGALFGSLFVEYLWWPWSLWTMGIFCSILAIVSYFIIPKELSEAVNPSGKIDIFGAITGTLGLIAFIYSWNQAPVAGWNKPYVYGVLIASIFIIIIFVWIEKKASEPIMPLSIWLVKGFPGVLASIALGWSSFGIFIYYIVQILQNIRGVSPLLTTVMLSPLLVFGLLATLTVSKLYGRVPGHYLLMISMICFCSGNTLIATMPSDQSYWLQTFLATLITPFGMDISFPAASLIVSNTIPTHQQGVAASMINTVINWSISLGLGIAGTIESEMIRKGKTNLEGYRSALYAGIGLSGASILVVLAFCRVKSDLSKEPNETTRLVVNVDKRINSSTLNSHETS